MSNSKYVEGYLGKNKQGEVYEIIARNDKILTVRFLATGTVKTAYNSNLSGGKIKDEYALNVYGKGCYGNPDKSSTYYKRAYYLWMNMLKRCYSTIDKRGYQGRTIVDARWLCFENFLVDLPQLINFDRWMAKEKYELDKDVIGDGSVYSKHTCQFLDELTNKSLGKLGKVQHRDY